MPDEAERRRQYDLARRRLIAARYVRDPRPRIKVRLPRPSDPILTRSLLALAAGIVLLVIGHQLGQPAVPPAQ